MNVWMDIAIPALVFAAGCLAVTIWALARMYHYKAIFERALGRESKAIEENARLHKVLQAYDKDAVDQSNRVVTLLAENGALKLKLDEALKAKSARAKPTAKPKEVP